MKLRLLTAAALLLPAPAFADTLIDNINGLSLDRNGTVTRFGAMVIDDEGKIRELVERGERAPRADFRENGRGRTVIPGLIDAHAHVMGLGLGLLTVDLSDTRTLAGLSEGVRFAQASGLDLARVFEAISGGAAQSWQMDNRWETMTRGEFDFGFAIDWMRKDLAIALSEAEAMGLDLPTVRTVDGWYGKVQAMGGNRQDTSALIRHLPEAGR